MGQDQWSYGSRSKMIGQGQIRVFTERLKVTGSRSKVTRVSVNYVMVPNKGRWAHFNIKLLHLISDHTSGCHYEDVFTQLRKQFKFSLVSKEIVLTCLKHYETSSDVISTETNCFLPMV